QAEDGIRDFHVTGVQTCALPIWVRAASAVMREAGRGSIVNISSLSGKSGNPGQTNYSAAKAGIVGLTKSAAKELANKGVRVNARSEERRVGKECRITRYMNR